MPATPKWSTTRWFARRPTQGARFLAAHPDYDEDAMPLAQADLMAIEREISYIEDNTTGKRPHSEQESIEPPSGAAGFLANHSAVEDPMAQAQADLMEGDWEMDDIEDNAAEGYPTPPATQRKVSKHTTKPESDDEDSESFTHADFAEFEDPAYQHEQHVRNMAKHIVPPYPIPGSFMSELADQSKAAQVHRFEMFMKRYYPGDAEQRKKAIEKANIDTPRFGLRENVRIVHVIGETREVSKSDKTKCDETCPNYKKKSVFGKLKAASGRLVRDMKFDTPS